MTNDSDHISKAELRRVRKFKARYRFGDDPRVFIYCDKHPQRVPVEEFHYTEGFWQPEGHHAREHMRSLAGDTLIPRDQSTPPDPRLARRFNYRLTCRICGDLGAVEAREDRLAPILDGLRGKGVSELALSVLHHALQRKRRE